METKVKFVAADMPEGTPFMLHIYAAVAEQEARAISARTKAVLAMAKQRGVRLGKNGAEILAPRYKTEAKVRAEKLAPVIRQLQQHGYSMRGIALSSSTSARWRRRAVALGTHSLSSVSCSARRNQPRSACEVYRTAGRIGFAGRCPDASGHATSGEARDTR
jgi:DNA invertase Pin-like site-specific DNA recombinase